MNKIINNALLTSIVTILIGITVLPAVADDGAKINKRMSQNLKLTVLPEEVGVPTTEAEHAFIDMMKFYVPAQAASGTVLTEGLEYLNVDETPVESLFYAKPLVSVFINGPAIGVEQTPFAHSFMDTFAAVSLDDGLTWKRPIYLNLPTKVLLFSDKAVVVEVEVDKVAVAGVVEVVILHLAIRKTRMVYCMPREWITRTPTSVLIVTEQLCSAPLKHRPVIAAMTGNGKNIFQRVAA